MNCKSCSKPISPPLDDSLFSNLCQECRERLSKALRDSIAKSREITIRAYWQNFGVPDSKIDELLKEVPPLAFFRGEE